LFQDHRLFIKYGRSLWRPSYTLKQKVEENCDKKNEIRDVNIYKCYKNAESSILPPDMWTTTCRKTTEFE